MKLNNDKTLTKWRNNNSDDNNTAMKEKMAKTQMSAEEAGEGGRDEGNGELIGFSSLLAWR